jgi:hypothetical protein
VTLDLTTPDHKHKQGASGNELRKNFKIKWLNSNHEHTSPKKRNTNPTPNASVELEAPSQTPRPVADNIGDDAPRSPEGNGSDGEQGNGGLANVQIMGLHSRNPIVSYKGDIYSCQWATNIGTELLFTEHDPDSTLPVLRHLPGHVDLLAASSTRIISNSIAVDPKSRTTVPPTSKKRKRAYGRDPTLLIPVGEQASDKRKNQAKFLQRLMEIKEDRGEEDEVTVYTEKKLSRNQWKKYLANNRSEERTKMQKIVQKNKSAGSVEMAKERLAVLDREDEKAKEVHERWLVESRLKGTGRIRIKGRGFEDYGMSARKGTPGSANEMPYRETGFMPTPQRWEMEGDGDENDLEEGMEDEAGEYDEDMAEDMFYDDEDLSEEVANGEDEDAQVAYGWS